MIGDPASAPPRSDLPYLRHRSLRRVAPPPAPPPTTTSSAAIPQAPVSSSLDLSDEPAPPAPATRAGTAATAAPVPAVHVDRRIAAGGQQLLGLTAPTVTLTRVQSGIGQLEIEAVCSPAVGDLRLGAAYQLADGTTSTVQYTDGNRFAPSSRDPVIVAGRDEYEHLRVDLRHARDLERMAVYAFSESRTELTWGGTLVVTTFGGARIELPLESLHPGRVAVLLSIYNLDGEFVIRAEMETIHDGDVREAARAYGYDRITWRDERSPAG
jgi:uncharacterized protein involved in tellurium resistance